ncbi:zinc-binding dehydrogenase [Nocardia thailandica]|uniref:zinc-binding dehydrogenase n=1 Tax=Nocardia thailandica TaxID=257275 RepID=UPI0002D4DFF5|nr:zinc-binding dehydrogenase [Nocardia thailandica]
MRAVQVTEFGGPEVLTEVEIPAPLAGPGEVVIDVDVADVMFLDARLRAGWGRDYFPLTLPYVPGGAVGGTVASAGAGVDASWIGKRVVTRTAASGIGGGQPIGGYAEQALAAADGLTEIPPALSTAHAVALAHDGRTALAVFDRAGLKPGNTVLITAAAGGLGTLLIQLSKLAGATVIAAARGPEKLALATRLGADHVVDYSVEGWSDRARALTGGVDVVFDGAGGELGATALEVAADRAVFLGYGSAAGDFAHVATVNRPGVTILTLFDVTHDPAIDWSALADRALTAAAAGEIEIVVGQTFSFGDAAAAHAAIESRATLGRTLLTRDVTM